MYCIIIFLVSFAFLFLIFYSHLPVSDMKSLQMLHTEGNLFRKVMQLFMVKYILERAATDGGIVILIAHGPAQRGVGGYKVRETKIRLTLTHSISE